MSVRLLTIKISQLARENFAVIVKMHFEAREDEGPRHAADGRAANDNQSGVFLKAESHHDCGLNLDWKKISLEEGHVRWMLSLP